MRGLEGAEQEASHDGVGHDGRAEADVGEGEGGHLATAGGDLTASSPPTFLLGFSRHGAVDGSIGEAYSNWSVAIMDLWIY